MEGREIEEEEEKDKKKKKEKKKKRRRKKKRICSERLYIITREGDRKFAALRVPEHPPPHCSCGRGRLEARQGFEK